MVSKNSTSIFRISMHQAVTFLLEESLLDLGILVTLFLQNVLGLVLLDLGLVLFDLGLLLFDIGLVGDFCPLLGSLVIGDLTLLDLWDVVDLMLLVLP